MGSHTTSNFIIVQIPLISRGNYLFLQIINSQQTQFFTTQTLLEKHVEEVTWKILHRP